MEFRFAGLLVSKVGREVAQLHPGYCYELWGERYSGYIS
jgi:hypothetical protein